MKKILGKWYNLNTDPTEVEVEWNKTNDSVIQNELKKGSIRVIKVDKDDNTVRIPNVTFEVLDKNGKHIGIAADIIKLISSKLNIELKIIPTKTWEESIEFSKVKKCDLMSFLNETPQRKEWLTFTEPIFKDPNVIIGRLDSPIIKDLSKIKASIAIPKGTAMYERFQKDFPKLIIIPVDSEDEAFKLVEEKKADLTVRSMIISAFNIKEKGFFNLKILNQPENYENQLRIGVIKNEPILKDILNKAIITLTKEDIQNIVNKWVAIKYEKVEDYTYLWLSITFIIILLVFFLYRQYLLKHNNNFLQNEVLKRTQQLETSNQILKEKKNELNKLNSSLEEKIKDEVEKNKIFQEKLFKADKLASMGEMISNIAHQWRQPLSVISTIATGTKLQKEVNSLRNKIKDLGSINVDSIEEYKKLSERYDFMCEQRLDLENTVAKLRKVISDMTQTMEIQFKEKFEIINKNFNEVFIELFGGGKAELILTDEENVLECGIDIRVQPTGKKLQNMMLLSGGEKAFTAIALLFAILKINPAPFCILDEIEAALDDVNVYRFAEYLKKFSKASQFLVITHRKGTMEVADTVYGVTMEENGISKLLSMRLGTTQES